MGKSLVTLFKNYMSNINFNKYIVFVRSISSSFKMNNKENFKVDNIDKKIVEKIKKGLIEESNKKGYIDENLITNYNVNSFLEKVTFVVDNEKDTKNYIEELMNKLDVCDEIINDDKLNAIFVEIRKVQQDMKNTNIENNVLTEISEVLNFKNHIIKCADIKMMALNIIVNYDFMKSSSIPALFSDVIKKYNSDEKNDIIEKCKNNIARTLFNKSNSRNFWIFFEMICKIVHENIDDSIIDIYQKIDKDKIKKMVYLDEISVEFMISLIKGAIKYDNRKNNNWK